MSSSVRPILAPGARTEDVVSPRGEPVPVTLLTGFLGAGKTTLLNRILNGDHGLRVGVLVNDFGAVNIDAALISDVEENTISLSNGCVCCEVRDDLVASLEQLLARDDSVDYVILEASGVADPESVVMTFLDARYEKLLRLDSITCLVDAEGLFVHRENPDLTMLKLRQIGFADLVVLNKVDLVGPENVELIRDWIGTHLNRVRIVEASYADVPLDVLLGVGRFDPGIRSEVPHGAHPQFETWHFTASEPLALEPLQEALRRLPASVYRCKGFVYSVERPGERLVVQSVGRRSTVSSLGPWGPGVPTTDLVVIGSSLDPAELAAAFDGCRAPG